MKEGGRGMGSQGVHRRGEGGYEGRGVWLPEYYLGGLGGRELVEKKGLQRGRALTGERNKEGDEGGVCVWR